MTGALVRHMQSAAAALAARAPVRPAPLATPPDPRLKPVMGDPGLPFIGHALGALYDMLEFGRRRYATYGPVSWGVMLGAKVVWVIGPEGTELLAANRDKAFANQGGYEYFIGPFLHRGLMLMDFEEHRLHRRIMQEAFARPRLANYLDAMNPRIARELDGWRPGRRFALYDAAKQLTLGIANEVFVGEHVGADADRLTDAFVDTVHGALAYIRANVPGGAWARGRRGRRVLEQYFRERLATRRADGGDDLFSVLCRATSEEGERFTDDDVVNHMIFMMVAAHDTSTITLAMMGYYLGRHPQWQDKARVEAQELGKDAIEFADLDRLTTLDLVMKEAMRINAPVGSLARETVRDTEILGHHIPAGTIVMTSTYATQRLADVWPKPDEFDPGRFAEDRREDKVHRYAWAPFGGGAHKCIGLHFGVMEVKAIMHQLLLRYRWTVPAGYEPPIGYTTGPMPTDGLPIQLEALRT
ncbi:cytochrome P450 [Kutzneria sp. NPDC052558]|uniref:cytochrome P450 n=1 Tax=Kutzneria sp. NPDC052558 TaxID=3364121 RepID=UPI0037C57D10